jgi:antitoxin component YwqK of YwqJK toxin-antitoxin module
MWDRDTAYVTAIPAEAEERIVERYEDGARKQAEYWLDGERVGARYFDASGAPDNEWAFRKGVPHGTRYVWHEPGQLASAEPYEEGVPHGTARQWSRYDGRLIGSYTLERGTGIDLWRQDWSDGSVELAEVHYMRNGRPHGFEWWLNEDQRSVWQERHWKDGERHGIERDWNIEGRLRRGYPRYWVQGERVSKRQYLRTAARDPSLPPFRAEENEPQRTFPPEVAEHLTLEEKPHGGSLPESRVLQ